MFSPRRHSSRRASSDHPFTHAHPIVAGCALTLAGTLVWSAPAFASAPTGSNATTVNGFSLTLGGGTMTSTSSSQPLVSGGGSFNCSLLGEAEWYGAPTTFIVQSVGGNCNTEMADIAGTTSTSQEGIHLTPNASFNVTSEEGGADATEPDCVGLICAPSSFDSTVTGTFEAPPGDEFTLATGICHLTDNPRMLQCSGSFPWVTEVS